MAEVQGSDMETADTQPQHAERPHFHRDFLDDIIAQMRRGMVRVSLADGREPLLFQPLGHGGENVVLSGMRLPIDGTPYNLPFVLKVGMHASSREGLDEHRLRINLLRRYMRRDEWFPHEHAMLHLCPDGDERLVIAQQPVRLEGAQHLCCGYAELRTDWAQREIGTLTEADAQSGGLPVLPREHPHVRRYERVNRHLVLDCADEGDDPVGRDEFLATQQSQHLAALANAMRRDGALRSMLRTFVERAITYTDETDEILDILGEGDNVVFRRDEESGHGRWTAALLDPLHPTTRCMGRLDMALMRLSSPEPPDSVRSDVIDALNGLNYVRTVNGLARMLNIEKRLMRWRRGMSDERRRMIDFPLILERCRGFGCTDTRESTAGNSADALNVPAASKWQIIRRKAD